MAINIKKENYERSRIVTNIKQEASESDLSNIPIMSITPFLMRWKICGIVTERSDLRKIDTFNGQSKVFDFCISDKEGIEIKVISFGDLASRLFQLVQMSKSYIIKGNNRAVKTANKRFNSTGHDYEILMRNDVEVIKCEDSMQQLPAQKINRISLSKIKMFMREYVDVVAIVDNMEDTIDIVTKNGVKKRKLIYLLDASMSLVKLTAWSESCSMFTADMLHKPIILKNAFVSEFNGQSNLTFTFKTKLIPVDDAAIVKDLVDWYTKERNSIKISDPLSSFGTFNLTLTIHAAIAKDLNSKDGKGGYFNTIARISQFKENMVYKACSQKDCKKKVSFQDGNYYCLKCNTKSETFKYALIVTLQIYDNSGSHWLTMFSNKAEELLKKSAFEIGSIVETHGDIDGQSMVTAGSLDTLLNFTIRSRSELYNDSRIFKWTIVDFRPVNIPKYAEFLQEMYKNAKRLFPQHDN